MTATACRVADTARRLDIASEQARMLLDYAEAVGREYLLAGYTVDDAARAAATDTADMARALGILR